MPASYIALNESKRAHFNLVFTVVGLTCVGLFHLVSFCLFVLVFYLTQRRKDAEYADQITLCALCLSA